MAALSLSALKQQYESSCNHYVARFCKKQGLEFDYWAGDKVGEIAFCGDFYFNFSDIVLDINSKQPKGAIIKWYYENLDFADKLINYYSYTKGLRVAHLESLPS